MNEAGWDHLFPLHILIHPYLLDHRFQGQAVLPAVEAMQALAASTAVHVPEVDLHRIEGARFDKFLFLNKEDAAVAAFNRIETLEDGRIRSTLITRTRVGASGITRTKDHVRLCFQSDGGDEASRGVSDLARGPVDGFLIPPDRLYNELVPFGPAYQNVREAVSLNESGAVADVAAAPHPLQHSPLGSPFPLDAAFHIACAWGQRYAGVVAFPVGLARRRIFCLTRPGAWYRAVARPVRTDPEMLVFDIGLFGTDGVLHESVLGVRMRDVSGGRLKPPDWVVRR